MNNKTMIYGLVVLGGLFAYYAWKKHSLTTQENSTPTTPLSHTSGVFVDDVPVDPKLLGITKPKITTTLVSNVKQTVSKIVDPIIGTKKQTELTGQGQFL